MILEKLDSHMQINEVRTHIHVIYKNKLKMAQRLNKTWQHKLLEDIIGKTFSDIKSY